MGQFVSVDRWPTDSRVGIVTLENPPVNAMSVGVPKEIIESIDGFNSDDTVSAILFMAGGSGIFGGADIKMQGKPWPADQPKLTDVIDVIDRNDKPIGILIQKTALGGGLEIAMACRYRIATPGTKVGQPEVKIGIPPGAGGTQRLPRLVGAEKALSMIVSGDPISVEEGLEIGLVDQIVSVEGAIDEAAAFLVDVISKGDLRPKTSDRKVDLEDQTIFEMERARVARKFQGQMAPMACIDCVEIATKTRFSEGFAYERKRFHECVASHEASSLRHVFFAERQAKRVPGISKDIAPKKIETAAVLGAGTMGVGIAICLANADIPVTLVDQNEDALERGMAKIGENFRSQVKKGRLFEVDAERRTGLVSSAGTLDAVKEADVIIEAVFEDMAVKKSVFAELSGHAKPGAILATNTSYLDVDEIAGATNGREGAVLGMHFFSPAHIMKLLEVVRGAKTDDDVLVTGLMLGEKLGKTAVVSGVGHGFIGNRMFYQYNREAEFLLQEGASVDQVDNALKTFGMAMGPFEVRDLAGLDIGWAMRKSTSHLRNPHERYSKVGDAICENGWFGQKTGKGFYLYEDGKQKANPDLAAIIEKTAAEAGIVPADVSENMVVERCLYAMVNEGAKILEQGIALRASDIDLVFINGYGFPRWRGGPMHWADDVGLAKVLAAIVYFNEGHDFWKPAPLLERLVRENKTFTDWDRENAS